KQAAASGNAAKLHLGILSGRWGGDYNEDKRPDVECTTGQPVALSAAQSKKIDAMLASHGERHAAIPTFDFPLADGAARANEMFADADRDETVEGPADDLAQYLASHMRWYIEWPHVDDTFFGVYRSLP